MVSNFVHIRVTVSKENKDDLSKIISEVLGAPTSKGESDKKDDDDNKLFVANIFLKVHRESDRDIIKEEIDDLHVHIQFQIAEYDPNYNFEVLEHQQ